jgi:glycosyltransferase involved in cell wall biosynthesis
MKKILIIDDLSISFVKKDVDLLKNNFDVTFISNKDFRLRNPIKYILSLIKAIPLARKTDYIYSKWLTSTYSIILGLLTRKKVILTGGGFDCVGNKELNYGVFTNSVKSFIVKFNLKYAYKIIVVHEKLKQSLLKNTSVKPNKIFVINNGFDFVNVKLSEKRRYITTISKNISNNLSANRTRHLVKGIDRFLEIARKSPEHQFLLIGYTREILTTLENNIPNNLTVVPPMDKKEIENYLSKTLIYCQLSRHEGHPNALCEAMSFGCIPIGTNVWGIPSTIGDAGYLFSEKDVTNISDIVLGNIIKKHRTEKKDPILYIKNNFSIEKRIKKFKAIFR